MSATIDGTYSVSVSGVAGRSILVATINNERVWGNDSSGARYGGTAKLSADGASVVLQVDMEMPPNTFGVWGTSNTETVQTRHFEVVIPREYFDNGKPYQMPNYDMTFVFQQADHLAPLAGTDGIKIMKWVLENAASAGG